MRILIAEDDSILADGLTRSLRQSGYAVEHVKSGGEPDTTLSVQTFDLLILDLGLLKVLLQRFGRLVSKEQLVDHTSANGARRSATTRSKSTCTGCARRSRRAARAST